MASDHASELVILGLDGLSWPLLEPLLDAGIMPHLARLRREGVWGDLTSVVPTQSASAWSSFITGQNPARHGVFDFTVRQEDGTYRHAKPHPATTLWHYMGQAGFRVGALNFPVTYPPDPVRGFLVSGMLSPKGRTFTYPPELGDEMLAAIPDYRLDVEWQLYKGREQALLRNLIEMTRQRAEAANYLRERFEPDCLAVAFIGPDRLQHSLWHYLDPTHPRHEGTQEAPETELLYGFYAALDDAVGRLVGKAGEGTTVIVLSDHGFQSAVWQFRVNEWLAEHGWLHWQAGQSRLERLGRRIDRPWVRHLRRRLVKDISRHVSAFAPGGTIDWSRTKAFSLWSAQQGIRVNLRGREPQGTVTMGDDYERLCSDMRLALRKATEPQTGLPVVDQIWSGGELGEGPSLEGMPDLMFTLRPGFASSPVQPGLWTPLSWASGDHSLAGMFVAWGRCVLPGRVEGARLIDIAPTALHLLGSPVPEDMDGKVLLDALDGAFVAANPERREKSAARPGIRPEGEALSAEEEDEVQARLRGLGYL